MRRHPAEISTLAVFVLGAFFIFGYRVGERVGTRQELAAMDAARKTLVACIIKDRVPTPPYANKREAMHEALLVLDAGKIFEAEKVVRDWVKPPDYEPSHFEELIDPSYLGFASGYLYNVIRRELNKP